MDDNPTQPYVSKPTEENAMTVIQDFLKVGYQFPVEVRFLDGLRLCSKTVFAQVTSVTKEEEGYLSKCTATLDADQLKPFDNFTATGVSIGVSKDDDTFLYLPLKNTSEMRDCSLLVITGEVALDE